MFSNRSLQLQFVRTPRNNTTTETPTVTPFPTITHQQMKDTVKMIGVAGVSVYAAVVALNTASEIAVNAAPKRH